MEEEEGKDDIFAEEEGIKDQIKPGELSTDQRREERTTFEPAKMGREGSKQAMNSNTPPIQEEQIKRRKSRRR
jgi:hypothetical protein